MHKTRISIRNGDQFEEVCLPPGSLMADASINPIEPARDPQALIEAALNTPIGTLVLEELAHGKRNAVILVDDNTRPTPAYLILPSLLARLEAAGVPREATSILVATGTHRPMTKTEMEAKIGADVLACYQAINHDYQNEAEILNIGNTPSGVPITLNRRVVEADLVLAVGNIVPHRYCGWAGGAKIIQPGVSGASTTAGTHLMITKDPHARLGVLENQVRREIEAVAGQVKLGFIVNTILDRYGNLVDLVAGDFRQAFRVGVEKARQVYSVPLEGKTDIVLASAYPSDLNLWQAGKALYAADLVVRDGGVIILASPCYEGIGEHNEYMDLLRMDYPTIDQMVLDGKVHDRIGAAAALACSLITARAQIWLVSQHITPKQAHRMNYRLFTSLQGAIDTALLAIGDAAKVTVLHEATEILPVLPE